MIRNVHMERPCITISCSQSSFMVNSPPLLGKIILVIQGCPCREYYTIHSHIVCYSARHIVAFTRQILYFDIADNRRFCLRRDIDCCRAEADIIAATHIGCPNLQFMRTCQLCTNAYRETMIGTNTRIRIFNIRTIGICIASTRPNTIQINIDCQLRTRIIIIKCPAIYIHSADIPAPAVYASLGVMVTLFQQVHRHIAFFAIVGNMTDLTPAKARCLIHINVRPACQLSNIGIKIMAAVHIDAAALNFVPARIGGRTSTGVIGRNVSTRTRSNRCCTNQPISQLTLCYSAIPSNNTFVAPVALCKVNGIALHTKNKNSMCLCTRGWLIKRYNIARFHIIDCIQIPRWVISILYKTPTIFTGNRVCSCIKVS